jgi:putative acetyltransferase
MNETAAVRAGTPEDIGSLESLYRAAFPEEDLLPLLRDLLTATPGVLSPVAVVAGRLVGHAAFTPAAVAGRTGRVALLGPLAVAEAHRGQGIARALVQEGARQLSADGVEQLLVLGDPAFYRRLGFAPEGRIEPPYRLPDAWQDAWQSRALRAADPAPRGRLDLPAAWLRPELWLP